MLKLPPGFKISVWASSVPQARQMAMGDKGTLFVGTFDKGTVSAVTEVNGKRVAKPFITGLRMPTGVAFMDHALYVIDIDKLYKYDDPEANLEKPPTLLRMPTATVSAVPSAGLTWRYCDTLVGGRQMLQGGPNGM